MANDKQPPQAPPTEPPDEGQVMAERRAKLAELRQSGIAYPNDFRREHFAADLHREYGALSNEEL
ncbi:MAG: lysine--tRNA ligase, partial [Usitatibacter sp.]